MQNPAIDSEAVKALLHNYHHLKSENPRMFARTAAQELGVSEGELLAAQCGPDVVRLDGNWRALLDKLETLGRVMCLTRNDWVVHERKGSYEDVRVREHTGAAIGPDLDLRYDFRHWGFGFAVATETENGTRESLQFFGPDGTAVHKIFKTDETDAVAWSNLVAARRADDQSSGQSITPAPLKPSEADDASIDVDGLQESWRSMRNTHQFPALMRNYGVSRPQCFRLAGSAFAAKLGDGAIQRTFEGASAKGLKLMVFVMNTGATQIHTGVPGTIKETGGWFNILDPDFNLHLLPEGINEAWLVRKHYDKGISRSVEAYDEDGEPIMWIFGKRKEDGSEEEAWRDFVESLVPNS